MESNKRQAEADRRRYDELLHERDMLNKVCVCVCPLWFWCSILTYQLVYTQDSVALCGYLCIYAHALCSLL